MFIVKISTFKDVWADKLLGMSGFMSITTVNQSAHTHTSLPVPFLCGWRWRGSSAPPVTVKEPHSAERTSRRSPPAGQTQNHPQEQPQALLTETIIYRNKGVSEGKPMHLDGHHKKQTFFGNKEESQQD